MARPEPTLSGGSAGRINSLRIRFLGDRVLQREAWKVAHELGWETTYDAEYVALTRFQADAFVTADESLA